MSVNLTKANASSCSTKVSLDSWNLSFNTFSSGKRYTLMNYSLSMNKVPGMQFHHKRIRLGTHTTIRNSIDTIIQILNIYYHNQLMIMEL